MTAKSHWREGAIVWRLGWARLRPRLWLVLVIVAVGAICVLLQNGWDDKVLQAIRAPQNEPLNLVADKLNFWGDWVWNSALAILLWLAGTVCKRKRWRQLGWACLWGFLVAAVVVNLFRSPLGRARPCAGVPDGFYGPRFQHDYQGFPSGHTTASFATAASVVSAAPLLSVPCAAYAVTVGWSRMQLNKHHPLDVLTGAVLGGFVGLCFGGALPGSRLRLRRKRRANFPIS